MLTVDPILHAPPAFCLPSEYHGADRPPRGCPSRVMSQSSLKDFDRNPAVWIDGVERDRTKAMDFGSLTDALLLTKDRFGEIFATQPAEYTPTTAEPRPWSIRLKACKQWLIDHPGEDSPEWEPVDPAPPKPWNNNSTQCREWVAKQEAAGLIVVHAAEVARAEKARDKAKADPIFAAVLANAQTQIKVEASWNDPATGLIVPLQGLIDIVSAINGTPAIIDLKCCRDASPHGWPRQFSNMGYGIQLALYRDIWNAHAAAYAEVERVELTGHLLIENPSLALAYRIAPDHLVERGRRRYEAMLGHYCQCLASGDWHGYDRGEWTVTEDVPWARDDEEAE